MKIVFFGTPAFSTEFLAALHGEDGFSIEAVVCQPDKPVGRKQILTPPETKVYALEHNIMVLQPESLKKPEAIEALQKLEADLFVVVAYGKIIPQSILDLPKLGCINVHPSLLPKYRGPSPIQSAILNQETETGVSIMMLDDKMDHGPILAQASMVLNADETATSLRSKVVEIGSPLLVETIKKLAAGEIKPQPQDDEQATICKLFEKADGRIDWSKSAQEIYAQYRALIEWPGVFTLWEDQTGEKTLKVHQMRIADQRLKPGEVRIDQKHLFVGTGTLAMELIDVQPENGSRMTAEAFIQGHKEIHGAILK